MSIRVTLNCQVKAGQYEILLPFLAKNLPNVRRFAGCQGVTVYFDNDNAEMLLEENWLGINQHQAYLQHIENNGILAELAQFLTSPPIIKYFEQQDI